MQPRGAGLGAVGAARSETSVQYEGWRVAGAAGAGVFAGTLVFFSFPLLLKPLAEEFGWSRTSVSSAFGILTLGAGLSAPLIGALADRVDAKWVCGPSLIVLACAFASLAGLTPHLWHLYLVFALSGIASTGTSAVVYAPVVSSWFDRCRGRALALVMSASAFGALAHPPSTSVLIRLAGWRAACVVLGVAILLAGLPGVLLFLRRRHPADAPSPAAALIPATTVADALQSRVFLIIVTVIFVSTLSLNGAIVHLAALLTDRGVSVGGAALAVSALGAASLVGRIVTGWLLDRYAAPRVLMLLLSAVSLGTFLLAGAGSMATGMLAAALLGFGTGGEADVLPYLLSRHFGLRSLSSLLGINWMAWGAAGATGPILMGRAYDLTGSYEHVLIGFAAGTLGTALLLLAVPAHSPRAVADIA